MLAQSQDDTPYAPEQLIVGGNVQTKAFTIAAGAAVKLGDVLGQVTATKKLIKSVKGAADGSQKPVAIASCDVDKAATQDTQAPVYVSGQFALQGLTFDASWVTEADKLDAFGIEAPIMVKKLGYSGN